MILSTRADYADRKLHVCTALHGSQRLVDLSHGRNRRFANAIQDHSALNAGVVRRAVGFHRRNQYPKASQITERFAQFRTQVLQLHSEQFLDAGTAEFGRCRRAFKFALLHRHLLEAIDAVAHNIGRNGEAHALGGNALWRKRHFRGRNTYQPTGEIDHRPAAVAGIDCGIRLHQIFIIGFINGDIPFDRAQHTPADGTAVSNGIAHYHHCLTEQVRRNIVEIDKWKIGLRVDFDKGQIGLVVARNVMRAIGFPVVSGYVNLQIRSTLYHVLVRHNVTRRIYYETGPQTLQGLTDFARSISIVTEELGVKIVEGIAHGALNDALTIDIHYRRQNL